MAVRPRNMPDAPSGGDEPDALQLLVQRAEAMATKGLSDIERHGLGHLKAGYPLHLRALAESGKTTLALRMAEPLTPPVLLLIGDACLDTRRLVGGEEVTRAQHVVDRCISSVIKVGNQTSTVWLDRTLTAASTATAPWKCA